MNFLDQIWLIPLFPLLGAIVMLLVGKKLDPQPPSEVAVAPGLEHTHDEHDHGHSHGGHDAHSHDHGHSHSHDDDHGHEHRHHHGALRWLVSLFCPGMVLLSFIFSAGAVLQLSQTPERIHQVIQFTWLAGLPFHMADGRLATFHGGLGLSARPAQRGDDSGGDRHRLPDPRLFGRVHGPRQRLLPLLRLPESVRLLHADAGAGEQLRAAVRRLGRRGALQLSADRVLLSQEVGGRCREEGVRGQPRGRRRVHSGHAADVQRVRHGEVCGREPDPAQRPVSRRDGRIWRFERHGAACCSSAPRENRRSFRCMSGCRMRWKAPRRSRR